MKICPIFFKGYGNSDASGSKNKEISFIQLKLKKKKIQRLFTLQTTPVVIPKKRICHPSIKDTFTLFCIVFFNTTTLSL